MDRPKTGAEEMKRGWTVILGALLCYIVSAAALPIYTQGVFIAPLGADFGWTRADVSMGQLANGVGVMLAAPFVGTLADRIGVRWPIGLSLLGVACAYVALGLMPGDLRVFLLIMALMSFFGSATTPIVFTRAINSWFDRARGLALGAALIGTGVTATFGPSIATNIILEHGWRTAYFTIAAMILAAIPFVVWLVRLSPWDAAADADPATQPEGMNLKEASRTRAFWLLAFAFPLQALLVLGLITHMAPMLIDSGLPPLRAAEIVGISGLAIISGRFFVGVLIDRFFAPWVAIGVALLSAAGCAALAIGGVAWAPLAAFGLGFAIGAEVDFIGYLVSRYFGLKAYGRIYGCLYAAFVIGASASPFWVGRVFDAAGTYAPALWTSAGAMFAVAALFLLLPRYAAPRSSA